MKFLKVYGTGVMNCAVCDTRTLCVRVADITQSVRWYCEYCIERADDLEKMANERIEKQEQEEQEKQKD